MIRFLNMLLWCLCITVTCYGQQPLPLLKGKPGFNITPDVMAQGDKIQITYNPLLTDTAGARPVKASIYLFRDFKWQGYDLPMTESDSGYTASYVIPEKVAMIACRFSIGDSIDRGGRFPYATVVYGPGKKLTSSALTEWGLLRSKNINGFMSPLVSNASLIEASVLVQLWISPEFKDMLVRRNLFFDIARGIKEFMPDKADAIVHKAGHQITSLADVTEKERISVEKVYREVLGNKEWADSLRTVIRSAYPDGLAKRLEVIKAIYLQRDKKKMVAQWEDFLKRYPFGSFPYEDYLNPALADPSFFINAYIGTGNIIFQEHRLDDLARMVHMAPFGLINNFYEHYVIYPFRQRVSPITDKEALVLSESIAKELLERIDAMHPVDREELAPTEWTKQAMLNSEGIWTNHVMLLFKDGQYKAALKLADKVKSFLGYKSIDFNTVFAKLLDHFKQREQAMEYITGAVKIGKSSPEMVEMLRAGYAKEHKGDLSGFGTWYEKLRPAKSMKEMENRLKASLIHIQAPGFKLQDLSSQPVELGKQVGKIIVLDFWASWCFPCKAAMPGMQTLVNKYRTDEGVSFYFISTLEEDPGYGKLVNGFLKEKKYSFNVLYDDQDPQTKKMGLVFNKYAHLLNLSGIPQKIVIDQKGFIRWVSTGFNGDLVELADEVSYVVDFLKKEKS